jgi:phenylacetic acid degradation operon negative regulatory protein
MATKPRGLILDLFGGYLRFVGPEIRAAVLVNLLGAFGVEQATARMTLSRLRQQNWLATRRAGRETYYRLSEPMLEILDEGRERIFGPYSSDWDGSWTQVVFQTPDADRAVRETLKKRLSWLGFGPLSTSTWLSPRPATEHVRALSGDFPAASVDLMRTRTDDLLLDRDIARRCWDLDGLNEDYRGFIDAHGHLLERAPRMDGASALVARTELVSTFRHFPFRDPQLPSRLRPDGWCGAQAHDLFRDVHRALAPAATGYVGDVIGEPVPLMDLAAENM